MSTELENQQLEENARPRIYEVGALFVASLGDDGVLTHYNSLIEWVTTRGGEIIADGGMPERFDLAYPMPQIRENKKTMHYEAYLGWFKFTLDASLVREFEDTLSRDLNIIRKIVFKTVKENTYIQRKNPRKRENARSAEEFLLDEGAIVPVDDSVEVPAKNLETEPEVNEIELEKKLDELVINK